MSIEWRAAMDRSWRAGSAAPRRTESLPVPLAAWRTLAAPLSSRSTLPAHDSSAMDGWAVAGSPPWRVETTVLAGDSPCAEPLSDGTARGIATGAPVPPGTLGILRSEHGVATRNGELLILDRAERADPAEPAPRQHVRPIGEETVVGDLLLAAGTVLTPPRLGMAAVSGNDAVEVVIPPSVDLRILGDEVVRSGSPRPGQVRDAFSPQFPPMLAAMGLRVESLSFVADDRQLTREAILDSSADLLITTGGSAAGPADHLRASLLSTGVELLIDGVAMRPGHPLILARRPDGRLIVGLPGNPLAAVIGLLGIGASMIDGLLGRTRRAPALVELAVDATNGSTSTRLMPYRLGPGGASPTRHQGSGMLRGLSAADGIAVIPPGAGTAGQRVDTLALPW